MLVVAKTPRIRVKITGTGAQKAAAMLAQAIEGACVFDDEEIEPLRGSGWFEKLEAELTAGRALHVYRTNAGLTLTTLSEKTGIPISHLSAMEHDTRPIGKNLAQRLAAVLNCDYRRFLSVASPEKPRRPTPKKAAKTPPPTRALPSSEDSDR
jgi:transcriptional regulator with XRE-family HTH domain